MKKLLLLIGIFCLIMPLMFLGCSGDDGAAGAPGAPGEPGDPGNPGPGAMANETCTLCHAEGKTYDTAAEHADNLPENQGTVDNTTITSVTFGTPVDNVVPVTVNFTFVALDAAGNNITSTIDLLTACGTNICARFSLAKLVAGTAEEGFSNHWEGYVMDNTSNGSSRFYERAGVFTNLGGGLYSYTFDNSVLVSDGYVDDAVHRVAIQLSGFPEGSFNPDTTVTRPVGNITADVVSAVGTVTPFIDTPAGYPSKEVVTTAACNACHNPLAIHGGGRREIKFCQVCHNPKSNEVNLVNLVHKVHSAQEIEWTRWTDNTTRLFDFTEVTYPQDLRNCTRCHQGGVDSDNWNTLPSIEACGACHGVEIFEPGGEHPITQSDSSSCATTSCHGSPVLQPQYVHRTENVTPNNPLLPEGLSQFEYFLDSVSVDNNVATVEFHILQDNVAFDLADLQDNTAFTSRTPAFLLAYALPQDGFDEPVDYNNLGQTAGQPISVGIDQLIADNLVSGTAAGYTAVLENDPFPDNAVMRAVALQGYFQQVVGGEDIGRHTPSVVMAVDGDDERRVVVKSGYEDGKPVGCLECHEIFEGHGGNRVNNVQVCVMCHNPNLSSSGRTVDPSEDSSAIEDLGIDPLEFPEATNNMKELIHGIHAATDRPYEFVRNRNNGIYYNWSEVTFPGNLADCQKCHLEGTYNVAPEDALWTTERTTTGNAAETMDDILGARASVPNDTDLVNSPTTSACFYCHDSGTPASHMVLQGGKLGITREDAKELP